MKAIVSAMERAARALGLGEDAASAPPVTTTMLDELEALWQPMVAVPHAVVIGRSTLHPRDVLFADEARRTHGDPLTATMPSSAAWCVIDLDSRVLSCESRGLWWDPFVIVAPRPSPGSALSSSGERALSKNVRTRDRCGNNVGDQNGNIHGDDGDNGGDDVDEADHRVLLQSVDRSHAASWWCEIVRGPHARGAERSIYYTNLTFSDVGVEPQRGIISGARLRTRRTNNNNDRA